MNNPIRALSQVFEARKMRKMSNLKKGAIVLEIGCGRGVGTQLINKYFKPKEIHALDLDERMIIKAKRRVRNNYTHFWVGDASKLDFEDSTFDAIFDFGIIHHIPNWEDCLSELYRALKPGGQLILEDLCIKSFTSNIFGEILKWTLKHPYKDMYTREQFRKKPQSLGFDIIKESENWFWFNIVAVKIN